MCSTSSRSSSRSASWRSASGPPPPDIGLPVVVEHGPNPRVEREAHYYRATHTHLRDLGLQPHLLSGSLLHSLLEVALRHRDRVRIETIRPRVDWRVPGRAADEAAPPRAPSQTRS